jgi:hypothetical protein
VRAAREDPVEEEGEEHGEPYHGGEEREEPDPADGTDHCVAVSGAAILLSRTPEEGAFGMCIRGLRSSSEDERLGKRRGLWRDACFDDWKSVAARLIGSA